MSSPNFDVSDLGSLSYYDVTNPESPYYNPSLTLYSRSASDAKASALLKEAGNSVTNSIGEEEQKIKNHKRRHLRIQEQGQQALIQGLKQSDSIH